MLKLLREQRSHPLPGRANGRQRIGPGRLESQKYSYELQSKQLELRSPRCWST